MKKSFELPKEFAEKWIEALESGDYSQVDGTLVYYEYLEDETIDVGSCSYCCLGVAAKINNCDLDEIGGLDLLVEDADFFLNKGLPEILIENQEENNLVGLLTKLNDGTTIHQLENWKEIFPNIIFLNLSDFNEVSGIRYNFKQIAEFIKLNVEFV